MNKRLKKQNIRSTSKGFTLLVAMIVTTLVLAIGFSIGNIILKELALSSSGRQSQVAFYAADSIAECALYWDRKDVTGAPVEFANGDSPFATSTPQTNPGITCGTGVTSGEPGSVGNYSKMVDNDSDPNNTVIPGEAVATTSFYANFGTPDGNPSTQSCAKVTIVKNHSTTTVESEGYNTAYVEEGGGACETVGLKTVERGLRVSY